MIPSKVVALVLASAASLAGCAIPKPQEDPAASGPVRWIVVEAPMKDIRSEGRWPAGGIQPESQVLVMAPVPEDGTTWVPEIHAHDYFVEVMDVDPEGPVGVGQVVTLTVRVGNAKLNAQYRLSAGATSGETRIVGRREAIVTGRETTSFSFTNLEDGSGEISIGVRAIQ